MRRWDYLVMEMNRDGELIDTKDPAPTPDAGGTIHELGEAGWELIAVWPNGGESATIVFKRQLRNDQGARQS